MSTKNETKSKTAATQKPAPLTPKAKDLRAKKDAKGGGRSIQHNETLICA